MGYLSDEVTGHGFDTDTLTGSYCFSSLIDEETFFDKLKRFLITEESDID